MISEEQQDQAALHVLGLLSAAEAAAFESALSASAELRDFVRELREAVSWVHEGEIGGKRRLAAILSNEGSDDFQRCIYYCLAGRGVVSMLDDLMWLEDLLERRGRVAGKLMRAKARTMPLVDPYVAKEPDGPVGVVDDDFRQGPSWWMDPSISR